MPTRISIELVPRDAAALLAEASEARHVAPGVLTVNIPDLLRFPLRSWDACGTLRELFPQRIPHLRAMDFCEADVPALLAKLDANGVLEILVVQGDPPQDLRKIHRTKSIELIRWIHRERPEMIIHGAFDPYRAGVKQELDSCKAKIEAGARGFFTQPFFDLRFIEIYAEQLQGIRVHWGLSPVLGDKSRAYWENRNNAVFPRGFQPTLEWNRNFARQALAAIRDMDQDAYFMPIRCPIQDYLKEIL
ncbi:MAG: hypothetical protein RL095_1524 [Verrucomicrobiota bacterium]|jgi:methylenetetrahydrofolate reductase (NADPH)